MVREERIECRNPDPTKQGTRVPRWKHDAVRSAILEVLDGKPEGVAFKDLPSEVRAALGPERCDALGSVSWHTTVVKLHLEATGEIERIPGSRPQVLRAPST